MPDSRFATLDDWLRWRNPAPRTIDLGLERVRTVLRRLQPEPPPTSRSRSAAPTARVPASPCWKRYCELPVTESAPTPRRICCATTSVSASMARRRATTRSAEFFARIDAARGDISPTYFEFGTLAALELFREAGVEVALLEVGLGGRLDAVNVVDADAALVVSIGLPITPTGWARIATASASKKAGIYRAGRPAICADPDPPRRLVEHARDIGATYRQVGLDYSFERTGRTWRWWADTLRFDDLPPPGLAGSHQIGNAAAVLMTLASLRDRLPVTIAAIRAGLARRTARSLAKHLRPG